jgi:GUN4-like/HNH endonuclease
MSELKLISDIGIDYTQLHSLLTIQNWLKADKETTRLILKAANKKNIYSLKNNEIATLPCEDLQIIDQLWMYYSQGRFGFSLQSVLWEEIIRINKKANFSSYCILAYKVGWFLEEGWLSFETKLNIETVPKGHFPRWGFGFISIGEEVTWTPGIMGLKMLSANIKILGYNGTGPRLDNILNKLDTLPPLENLFSRIKTCDLANITTHALPTFKKRLQQNQEIQAAINKISATSEVNQLDTEITHLLQKNYYSPKTKKTFNKRIITSIAQRQGQPLFRKALLEAYNYRCTMTGCDAQEALEAAHIIPYCETEDNDISNGLLLRADLHTLFDLNLIAINPITMKIHIAPNLVATYYEQELQNKSLRLPINESYLPSQEALQWRCEQCGWYRLYS